MKTKLVLLAGVLLATLVAVPTALSQTSTLWPEPDNSYEDEGSGPPSTPYPAQVQEIAWSPDGELIAVGSGPPTCYWEGNAHFVRIFDAHSGALLNTLTAANCPVNDIDWSRDSQRIVSSSYSRSSWISAVVGEYPIPIDLPAPYPSGYVQNVWSPVDDQVASVIPISTDEVVIWRSGNEVGEILLQIPDEQATSVTWRPDGQVLALSSMDGGILVHDSFNGQQLQVLTPVPTYLVAWSPNGSSIAGVNEQHMIQVWDAQTGALLRELPGHTGEVEQLRWSGDSRYLLTASHDGTIRTWDTETGESAIVEQRDEPIYATDWDPIGRWIVVPPMLGTSDGASPVIVPDPLIEELPTATPTETLTSTETPTATPSATPTPAPTPTPTPSATPTPAAFQRLRVTAICSDDPATSRRWRIRNPNPYAVPFTWEILNSPSGRQGTGNVPAAVNGVPSAVILTTRPERWVEVIEVTANHRSDYAVHFGLPCGLPVGP